MYPADYNGDAGEVFNCRCTMVVVLPKYTGQNTRITYREWENSKLTISKNFDIGDEAGIIKSPIESRNNSKGKPQAVRLFDVPLNNRQTRILENLSSYNSRIIVDKNSVSMKDLSALTAKTGDEFALFTKGNKRMIVRGSKTNVPITAEDARIMASNGYKWSGHTPRRWNGNKNAIKG